MSMQHIVKEREIYDIPIKTQVTLHVVVTGEITQVSLNALLDDLFLSESQSTGFQYSNAPTHIFIYLYESEAHAKSGAGQWLSMLSSVGINGVIKKTHREEYIQRINLPNEDKFSLTASTRKEIWKEVILAEREANQEADGYYPVDPSSSQQVGQSLIISRQTPLMPSLGVPSSQENLSGLVEKITFLPPETTLLVTATQLVENVVWHLAEARSSDGDFLGKGWINGIALMGQTHMSTLEQIRRHEGIRQNLEASSLERIADSYGITLDQLHEISVEGLVKNWPFPVHE